MATARFLERARRPAPDARHAWSSPRRCRSTARASTSATSTGASPRARGPRSSSLARAWELRCPACGRELTPMPTRETKPLIPTSVYAITKRDHEELCLVVGRGLRHPDGRPALLQRLRPGPGALEPVHRCRRDLRLAAAERPPAGHLRGRRSSRATSSTSATSSRASCSRSSPRQAVGHAVNLGTGRPTTVRRGRRASSRPGSASTSSPSSRAVPRRRHPPLLRRPDPRRASCSASRPRRRFEDGMGELRAVGRRDRRPTTGSTTPPRSWPPAVWPASGLERSP